MNAPTQAGKVLAVGVPALLAQISLLHEHPDMLLLTAGLLITALGMAVAGILYTRYAVEQALLAHAKEEAETDNRLMELQRVTLAALLQPLQQATVNAQTEMKHLVNVFDGQGAAYTTAARSFRAVLVAQEELTKRVRDLEEAAAIKRAK